MLTSDLPPKVEGLDLSVIKVYWEDLAASEMRMHLMVELGKIDVGFADIEEFNLGLTDKFRSRAFRERGGKGEILCIKVVKAAMEAKLRDKQLTSKELNKERDRRRSKIAKKLGNNTKRYRTAVKYLRDQAIKKKESNRLKYYDKLEHLRTKYREDEERKLDKVPANLERFESLSIFSQDKFDDIEVKTYDVICIGDIEITD
jgi:hypothetical protein